MPTTPILDDVARRHVATMRRTSGFDVLFGGPARDERLVLAGFHGTRTRALNGLVVGAARGLGGRAVVERRPVTVVDYAATPTITHDYDAEVAAEGIVAMTAVPVLVRGRVRGALYGGHRRRGHPGDRRVDAMVEAADQVSRTLEVEEEVAARQALAAAPQLRTTEALTSTMVALRELAAAHPDNALTPALQHLERRLSATLTPEPADGGIRLTPRERDLVTLLSLGMRNAEIAERLELRPQTVKTYVRDLMAKLHVRTRHEAVVAARAAGLLA